MPRLVRPSVAALLLTAAVLLRSGSTSADATHPLDPTAAPGVLATESPFEGSVPLLDREAPTPSFVMRPVADGQPTTGVGGSQAAPPMPMDHTAMGHAGMAHGAHGAAAAE